MANGKIVELDNGNFAEQTSRGVTLVDFWAPWCGPCRMLNPVLKDVATELGNSARVGKVNVDESPGIASRFGVRSIPAIFVIKDGEIVDRLVGLQPKSRLVQAVSSQL